MSSNSTITNEPSSSPPPPPPPPPPSSSTSSLLTSLTTSSDPISTTSTNGGDEVTITETPTKETTVITVTTTNTSLGPSSSRTNGSSTISSSTAGSTPTGGTGKSGGGLEGPTLIAVAVIVPVVIVALVVVGVLLYFRKRKDKRAPSAAFKGNLSDSGGPIGVAVTSDNSEDGTYEMGRGDGSGYRGWGSTGGGRKSAMTSTIGTAYPMSSMGRSVSDGGFGNSADTYHGSTPTSPISGTPGSMNAPLLDSRPIASPASTEASTIGAMPTFESNKSGLNRGVSNASSNYSTVSHSDQSDYHVQPYYGGDSQDYDVAYFTAGPNMYYDDPSHPPPVIRDVQARRNTRIETPTSQHHPQQGSSGIAQNF